MYESEKGGWKALKRLVDGVGRKMRWPDPFFLSLFIVLGPINLSEDSRIHAENNQGDHMLLLRGKIYSISSSYFRFAFLPGEEMKEGKRRETVESGKFHPILLLCLSRPKIFFIYT